MALVQSLAVSNTVVTVNGRRITNFGQAETPINEEAVNPKRMIMPGQGGGAVLLERVNPGRRVSLSVLPGSADAAFLHGLYTSGAIITYTRTQIGSLETSIGTEGVIITEESEGRGGTSVTDDVFTMQFNIWESMKGG